MDIIQNFKFDPDTKASIQLVTGDSGGGLTHNGEMAMVGPTYHDIFKARIRIGTFGSKDMPNHGFLAVLTDDQIRGAHGTKWLKILREEGFEFLRTVDNSVYTGPSVKGKCSSHPNHVFALFRNIGSGSVKDQFTPPTAWTSLPDPYSGDMSQKNRDKVQRKIWDKSSPTKIMTKTEIMDAGAPVILAGLRSKFPQEPEEKRSEKKAAEDKKSPVKSAFPGLPVAVAVA